MGAKFRPSSMRPALRRRLPLLFFLALAGAAAAGACKRDRPGETTFAAAAPEVGRRTDEVSEMTLTAPPFASTERTRRTEEVLAASGDVVTKVKVVFREAPPTIRGKTYVVEAKDGAVAVADGEGRPVPAAEADEVRRRYAWLGAADPVRAALPTSAVAPGTELGALAQAIARRVGQGAERLDVSDAKVTFKGPAGDEGVFDVAMKLTGTSGDVKTSTHVRGEMRVARKTGAPTKITLTGPVTLDGPRVKATGDLRMALERTPAP